ncbi:MAG: ABC transporter substrate-binding protein [Defluviitaleaceae bacterium]|nr:ABC transporter substrate-binding protein [Defluviitaleaceae bacterium]
MKTFAVTLCTLVLVFSVACGTPGVSPTVDLPDPPQTQPAPIAELPEQEYEVQETIDINIGVLMGPTGLGALLLMEQGYYNFEIFGSPDEIVPQLIQGNIDLAAVPANLASVLYNNTDGAVQVLAINTLGVLHIVDATGEIETIQDLENRTIFLSGLGGVPQFALNYVLEMNGLTPGENVTLEFRSEHTEIAALLESGEAEIALLPQPFVTVVSLNNENLNIVLDLTEEWNRVQPNYALVMGVMVGRREFIDENEEGLRLFLEQYQESTDFVNANVAEAAQLAVDFGILPSVGVATHAIPGSNIVFISGEQMQQYLQGFLGVLYGENPVSVGGSLPGEDFYFD